MDAIVQPGTNPGFAINDDHKHCYDGYRDNHDVVLHEIADGTRAILNDVGNNSRAVLHEVADASRVGIKETSDAARDVNAGVNREGHETRNVSRAHREADERFHLATREAAERGFLETRLGVERTSGEIRRDNLTSFSDLDKFLCGKFEMQMRDTLIGFKDTQLFAAQNQAKLSAELAECCCEVKELVRAEAGATRELIKDNETQRLRDALASANQELLTIRLSSSVKV